MPVPYRRAERNKKDPVSSETRLPRIGNGLFTLLVSGGFGAIVAGAFGLGGDILKRPQSAIDRQCATAVQVLLDETPNPYIAKADLQRIGRVAALRSEHCMNGDGR